MQGEPYYIDHPKTDKIPVLLSIPHCGTEFPEELEMLFKREIMQKPVDTDWYLDKLYDFAPEIGVTTIRARYSRYVIDLNRNPENEPLYTDSRVITDLCPATTFAGEPIYKYDPPDKFDIKRRKEKYYDPYHNKIRELLDNLMSEFGEVLLFDAHSIRERVPSIHPQPFPDLILGDNKRDSADDEITRTAMRILSTSDYEVAHNYLFRGGYITRHYGKPKKGFHALQLEMTKINYMDYFEEEYDEEKAAGLKELLKKLLRTLGDKIIKL